MFSAIFNMRKSILAMLIVLLLSSCGDSCYDEVSISDDGGGYTNKTYSHTLPAKQKEWEDTGINLSSSNNRFTIADVEGTVSCTGNPNFPGECSIDYTTMCDGGKKYICNDNSCNNKTLVDVCAGKTDCTSLDSCSGTNTKVMCKNGVKFKWNNNAWEETTTQCSEAVSCNNNRKIMSLSYYIGSEDSAQYFNTTRDLGACSANERTCADGHPHPVPANKETWTLIDSNIFPGDDIYLKILQPRTSGAVIPTTSSGSAAMNAWTFTNKFVNSSKCPSTLTLDLKASNHKQCGVLENGYHTCPMCEGSGRHIDLDSPTNKTCDGSKSLKCWHTGGSGLWMKIIYNNQDCNDNLSCEGDSRCTWFNQYNDNIANRFGVITYQPQDNSGDGCESGDYSKCTDRVTTRHIIFPQVGQSKICAKIADNPGEYSDNVGGYTIYATRKSCLAHDGRPSVARFSNIQDMLALEYIVSNISPSADIQGTALSSGVKYPLEINTGSTEGKLYIRVRDNYWADNSGSYDVKIKYKKYESNGVISDFIEGVKDTLRHMTIDASRQFFRNISCVGEACNCMGPSCTSQYVDYIRALLILYIAGYGLMFLMGSVDISQMDLMIRVLKIGVVLTLISDTSFDFFYNNFFNLFLDGMDDLIAKSQSGFDNASDSGNVFAFADNMISLTLLSKTTWLKLAAMLFISPMGMILGVMLIIGVLLFLLGVFKAVVVYLMATLVIGILILLAPIFIPFILFKPTAHLFENWLRTLVQYSLEPVLLLIGLGVLTQLAYVLFTTIINFHVCWKCMWPINFAFWPSVTSALSLSDTIFCLQWFGPFGLMPDGGGGDLAGLGFGAVEILLFIIIGHLMFGYDKLVQQIILRISKGRAARFKLSGQFGRFSSVGDAVFRSTGIPQLASAAGGQLKTRAKRAVRRAFSSDTEEQKLLKQAKKVDEVRSAEITGNSRALSNRMGEELQRNASEDVAKLKNTELPDTERIEAAKNIGENLYSGVGDTPEFKEFVSNLDRLSKVEVGSKAHSKFSSEASELHNALQGEETRTMLEIIQGKDFTAEDKTHAMGRVSEALYKETGDVHKALFDPELVDARNKLINEVGQLERVLPDTLRKGAT